MIACIAQQIPVAFYRNRDIVAKNWLQKRLKLATGTTNIVATYTAKKFTELRNFVRYFEKKLISANQIY